MPIYEYACPTCDARFELLQPVGAEPPETCPTCGAAGVRKLVSATSFVLKGSGWYRDHYGLKPGGATPSPSSSSSSSSSSSPATGAGEAKAAAK